MSIKIGEVYESTNSVIKIKLDDYKCFEDNKESLKVGQYLTIEEGNVNNILATIINIKTVDTESDDIKYFIDTQPIGSYVFEGDDLIFSQGNINIPSPTEPVSIPDINIIDKIFLKTSTSSFYLGKLSYNNKVNYYVNGNAFFSKHIGVVGSTGSGKSCAVAKVIQEACGIKKSRNENKDSQKNSHIIIFDIHSEYKSAFSLLEDEKFTLNNLDVEKMCIPY